MIGCKETICTTCSHREVCQYKEQFLKARTAVDDVNVTLGEGRFIKLRDIKWLAPVDLLCNYYTYSQGGIVR